MNITNNGDDDIIYDCMEDMILNDNDNIDYFDKGIVIWLPWPPTVNSYWKPVRNAIYLSRTGRLYKELVSERVAEQVSDIKIPLDIGLLVEVTLYPPDNKGRDLDNYMKALLDGITATKLWEDDKQIDQLFVYRGEVTKGGSVRVEIHESAPLMPIAHPNDEKS